MMKPDEMIAVIQAHKDGKKIEYLDGGWRQTSYPVFNFQQFIYRVKREPRQFTVALDSNGKVVGICEAGGSILRVDSKDRISSLSTIRVQEIL